MSYQDYFATIGVERLPGRIKGYERSASGVVQVSQKTCVHCFAETVVYCNFVTDSLWYKLMAPTRAEPSRSYRAFFFKTEFYMSKNIYYIDTKIWSDQNTYIRII